MWRMIYDILRFNAKARQLVSQWNKQNSEAWEDYSIGEYLEWGSYSDAFRDNYLIVSLPTCALVRMIHRRHFT